MLPRTPAGNDSGSPTPQSKRRPVTDAYGAPITDHAPRVVPAGVFTSAETLKPWMNVERISVPGAMTVM
jgi:hypothetical protein